MARHKRSAVIAALTLILVVGAGIVAALAFAKQPSPGGSSWVHGADSGGTVTVTGI
jgi:ABC-type spermidine/putrescine transport system permease subunit II